MKKVISIVLASIALCTYGGDKMGKRYYMTLAEVKKDCLSFARNESQKTTIENLSIIGIPAPDENSKGATSLNMLDGLIKRGGKVETCENVGTFSLGTTIIKTAYLTKREHSYLFMDFTIIKHPTGYSIENFNFQTDDDPSSLLNKIDRRYLVFSK